MTDVRWLSRYDDRLMEFVLMKLHFPDSETETSIDGEAEALTPIFTRLATFKTIGVVMNVFLLDPSSRLLSAFVWVSSSNTIGLYALLDWDKEEYVFIDTGIECVSPLRQCIGISFMSTDEHCSLIVDVIKLVLYSL